MPHSNAIFDSLEARTHFAGQNPIAINFNDESLWPSQFSYTVAKAKELGITAVRLWLGFESYSDRPNAWDSVSAFRDRDVGDGQQRENLAPEIIRAAFALKREGFSVNLVVQPQYGQTPSSDLQIRGFIRHMMEATETQTSTTPLKDIVDMWEIGNEVDNSFYWKSGLQSYVDNLLIPAADELHANGDHEKVISAGVSYNPADLKTILDRLQAVNRLDAIDYAGFHPYGAYDPNNPSINEPKSRTLTAKSYADAVGKKLVATEWNIRGFGTDGSKNATWAKAMDDIFKTVILPNYDTAFFFALTNNWKGRGGSVSARPGSLLKHDGSVNVSPTSSYTNLENYYNSTLLESSPFFSTFKQWQNYAGGSGGSGSTTGSISGVIFGDNNNNGLYDGNDSIGASRVVFIDTNANGKLDSGEKQTTSDANGIYTFSNLAAGTYNISRVFPSGYQISNSSTTYLTFTLADGQIITGANIGSVKSGTTTGGSGGNTGSGSSGSIAGLIFGDNNANGVFDASDTKQSGKTVYIDTNNNNKLDTGEKSLVSDSSGNYKFTGLTSGTYRIRRVLPSGYKFTNPTTGYYLITLNPGQVVTGKNFGSKTA